MANGQLEPGSFRDRQGQVFYKNGKVYRLLKDQAYADFKLLKSTRFWKDFSENIISTEEVKLPAYAKKEWAGMLHHQRVPFISYPFEWCFSQLKDAAILHLKLMGAALDEDFILKDASPYNIQFIGHRPVLIDVPSLTQFQGSSLWVGYRQFCQMFLYPLMIQSYKDIDFQPELRSQIDGIKAERANKFFWLGDRLRAGVFVHVYLQAKAQARFGHRKLSLNNEIKSPDIGKTIIKHNLRSLHKILQQLIWERSTSEWSHYAQTHSYDKADQSAKEGFIKDCIRSSKFKLVWDLGCNTGHYSKLVAGQADFVLAADSDHLAVEKLYFDLKSGGPDNIIPMVLDLANPTSALGWRESERKALSEREKPELMLALALIHHLAIGNNIPLDQIVDWLAEQKSALVVEFVGKSDDMVQKLLQNREDIFSDYTQQHFEKLLKKKFRILKSQPLKDGDRVLYFAKPVGRR